jgi:hypothetical protein
MKVTKHKAKIQKVEKEIEKILENDFWDILRIISIFNKLTAFECSLVEQKFTNEVKIYFLLDTELRGRSDLVDLPTDFTYRQK